MESLWQDCRYAVRGFARKPGFTAVAVVVLALGIGANTAVFGLTNSLLLRPLVAEDPHELVALYSKNTDRPDSYRAFSYPNYVDIREGNAVFTSLMAHDLTTVGLREGGVTRRLMAETVSSNYFETFGVSPFRGRFFTAAEEDPGSGIPVVVVSHRYWKQSGEDDLVGETLQVNGQALTVVGIAPPGFTGRTALLSPALYVPLGMHERLMNDAFADESRPLTERDYHRLSLVGRLQPGVTMEQAGSRLSALASRMEEAYPAVNDNQTIILGPLSRLSVSTAPTDDSDVSLLAVVLLGMTGIVLLTACINLANMLLARGAARRKELAIRAAIGGGRGRILRQLLTEGMLLSLVAGIAALLVAYWVNRLLGASLNRLLAMNGLGIDVVLHPTPDARVLLATMGFCILGTLLFGLGPALKQSRPDVMDELKEQAGEVGGKDRRLLSGGNLLVVSQIALSLVLLVSAGLFIRAAFAAADIDPGFSVEDGLLVEVDPGLVGYDEPRSRDLYRRLLERLRGIPGIESAGVAATVPFGTVSSGRSVRRAGDPADSGSDEVVTVGATSNVVGHGYFEALGVPVLRGRGFTRAETESDSGPAVVVIDERLSGELWPGQDPLGRRIAFGREPDARGRDEARVVGVVATVRDDLWPAEPRSHVYLPFGQNFQTGMHIHLRAASTSGEAQDRLLRTVRSEIRAVDEQLPILGLRTLQGHLDQSPSLWMVEVGADVFSAFGLLALFLSVVGVYGVNSWAVARRTREIGIRQALGATTRDALWLVLRDGVILTLIGLSVGLVLAAGVGRLLGSFLYEVSTLDPMAFLAAPVILAAASLLATWLPARRAAGVAPVIALRDE